MNRPTVSIYICVVWLVVGQNSQLILQPYNYDPNLADTYVWTIPPTIHVQPTYQQSIPTPDARNQELPQVGGFGHPLFTRRFSQEQLNLPNEFLVTPNIDSQRPLSAVLQPQQHQPSPVNYDGAATAIQCNNGDCHHPPQLHQPLDGVPQQSNLIPIQSSPYHPPLTAQFQSVHWPGGHGGGIGLMFFVPESASHLPVEQLIRQQVELHRAKLPFDIATNCEDVNANGNSGPYFNRPVTTMMGSTATTYHGEAAVENVENVNYATRPNVKNVNITTESGASTGTGRGQQRWRNISEMLAQQHQHQQQQQHQHQQQHQQQQQHRNIYAGA